MNYSELKVAITEYQKGKERAGQTRNQLGLLRDSFVEEVAECKKCGRKEMLTLDHIVPLSFLAQLGFDELEDNDENWQVLCRPCNQYKQNRFDFTNPKTKILLRKYIERL